MIDTNFKEIILENVKYAMIPLTLFDKVKDKLFEAIEEEFDIEDIKKIDKKAKTYSAAEIDKLLFSKNPVKDYREFEGLTQEQLASMSGLSKDYISKIEQGVRKGSLNALKKIAKALNVHITHLIDEL